MPRRPSPLVGLLATFVLSGCGGGGGGDAPPTSVPPPAAVDAVVTIDNRAATILVAPAVNRRLLGSNVQWTNGSDGLLGSAGIDFAPAPLAQAVAIAPTVIRYPGGGLADTYHWPQGIGAAASRGTCLNVFTNAQETVRFGTGEFLSLCDQTGAEPLITLNVITADASESAAWVTQVNGDPAVSTVPRCRDWEVGNEPYFVNDGHPELNRTAAEFAAAYNAHAAAVIARDPRIRVGLPLLGVISAGLVPAERRTWNEDVAAALTQRVDFIAVHDAYLPFFFSHAGIPPDSDMLRSVLASAPAVDADLTALRAQVAAHASTAPFALTEHNSLMTVFGTFTPIPRSDGIPCSLAGAVYTADLLCTLAKRDDVESAEHWSLIGNWMFGAMDEAGDPRPSGRALQGLGLVFSGRRLPTTIAGPTADVPAFGALPAQTAMPLVNAFTTIEGGTLRAALINRSPTRDLRVRLACMGGLGGVGGGTTTVQVLNAADPLEQWFTAAGAPTWVNGAFSVEAAALVVTLPAHALVIVTAAVPVAPTGIGRSAPPLSASAQFAAAR